MHGLVTISCLVLLAILTFPQTAHSKNILVWGAVGTHSIRLSMTPFMEALADKGHNVTFITVFEDFEKDPNKKSKINTIVPKKWKEDMGSWEGGDDKFIDVRKTSYGSAKSWYDLRVYGLMACQSLYSDPEFVEWLKTTPKFDLVVVEMLFNECAYGPVHMWDSKMVIYSTTSVVPDFPDAHGLPDESSSISDIMFGFPSGNEMTFFQRAVSAFNPILYTMVKEYSYFPQMEEITRQGWKLMGKDEREVPSFSEVGKNASLLLLTTHFSVDYPRSFPPNVIPIGGSVVTKKRRTPLSKEMADFLKSAKEGFIYICFGSVLEFSTYDESTQEEFVKALYQFPNVKFLWKSSTKINLTLPDNVMLTPWAPQQTILDQPNIKAFISHSGMGGTTEAIHFSVPIISFPVLAEQDQNAQVVSSRGAGIKLELIGLKQEELQHAISEMLHNDKYKHAMGRLTKIFKDRPTPPLENGVWWVEYIMRHDNTNDFLRPPSVHQPWWKRRQIDVWLISSLVLGAIFYLPIFLLYWAVRRAFSKESNKPKISKAPTKSKPKHKVRVD